MTEKFRNRSLTAKRGVQTPLLAMICLVAIIAFLALSGILHLNTVANQRTDSVQSLQSVARYAEQLRRYEAQVLSANPADGLDLDTERTLILSEFTLLGATRDTLPLETSFNRYMTAFEQEAQLVATDNIGSAVIVHRTQTVPAGIAFRTEVDSALTERSRLADVARMRAMIGIVGLVALAFVLVATGLVLFDRNRRGTIALISKQEQRFRSIVEHGTDVTVVVNASGAITFVTPAVKSVFGVSPDSLTNKVLIDSCQPSDKAMVRDFMIEAIAANGSPVRRELRFRRADRSVITLDAVAVNRLDDPAVAGIVFTARDVSDRKALVDSLRHQAHHDSLTGLPNRLLLGDRLDQAMHRSVRHNQPVSVLFIDLDGFKAINDLFGHAGGDQLLIAVTRRLQSALRLEDTLARLGGDEFVVVLEQCDEQLARTIALRLLEKLAGITIEHQEFDVLASIGIAVRLDASVSGEELLRRSDLAMYQAKADLRNSIAFYQEGRLDDAQLSIAGD